MKQITKRIMSSLIAFVMLLSLMPSMAFAAETGNGSTKPNFESVWEFINSANEPGDATYKGMSVVEKGSVLKYSSAESVGEETGLYYVIAETSEGRTVLGIGGNGEIPACDYRDTTYNSYKKMPWAKYDADHPDKPIQDIYLENGVTRVCAFSFYKSKAETLRIADSVNQIDNAFQRCYDLKEIYVPITTRTVNSFAVCAGDDNSNPTIEIIYVDTGKDASVATHTFGDKSGITKVTFPASLTTITDNYFSDTADIYSSLTELKFEDGNNVIAMTVSAGKLENIADITGLSSVSKAVLLGSESLKTSPWYNNNQSEIKTTEFTIIDNLLVKYEGNSPNVTIPEGIEVIGSGAFYGNSYIESVTIPESVNYISERAFLQCRNLKSVTFEGADEGTSTLKIIGKLAFAGTAIKEITLPASLETIEEAAFVNVGETFAKTEEYSITNGSVGEAVAVLEKVHIVDTEENPSKLKAIGKFAFNSCRNLTEINIPDSVQSFAMGSFRRCMSLEEINLPEGMKAIPGYCFVFCESLTSVTIPESVESIGDWAFEGCSGLTEIRIPANVNTLGYGIFAQQGSIKAFYIDSPDFTYYGTDSGKTSTFAGSSDCKMYVMNQEVKTALGNNTFLSNKVDNIIIYPAVIGSKGYPTLADAVAVAGDNDTIVTPEHKYTKHSGEEPTCIKQGVKAHWECQVSGCDFFIPCEGTIEELSSSEDRERQLTIPMVEHTLSYVDEVPATYEADGVKAHQHCSVCGKNFINGVEKTDEELRIPKLTRPSSGGNTSHVITVENTKHGDVSVSPKSASRGTTVTITVEPDDGYKLDTLTVTDDNGNVLKLTDKGDGKYTFTMPASKVSIAATFTAVTETPVNPFTDVKESDYYYDAVLWAVENGITEGTTATTFSPNAACTRAQMVTFLWRAAGSPVPKSSDNPFADVEAGSYYYDAVLWAIENGITNGTSANAFSPDAVCTRSQTVTFLYRAAGKPEVDAANAFTDVNADAYYADAVDWAVQQEITNGTGNNAFSPNADCTRGQIVTFLYRAAQ